MGQILKNVVLIGASGNIGVDVLAALRQNQELNITVLTRSSSKATFPPTVKVHRSDYSASSLEEVFKGQDVVVSLLDGANLGQQTTLIDAAVKAGVKRFVPSEFGSDTNDPKALALVPIFGGKIAIINYLRSKEKDGLSWTALINGLFFDWGLKTGFLDIDLKNKTAKIWDNGDVKCCVTNTLTVGKALAALFADPSMVVEAKNRHVYIASHVVSQNEILAALYEVTGEKYATTTVDSKATAKAASEELAKGNFGALYDLIRAHSLGEAALGDFSDVEGGLWNERLKLPKEDMKTDIKRVLGEI